jgi:hypothetical protein
MKCNSRLLIYFVVVSSALLVPAEAQRPTGVRTVVEIDTYARSIDIFIKRNPNARFIVADVSSQDDEEPRWKQFASEAELEKFRESRETYTVAYNFRKSGRIVASNFTNFSPSGDWARYTDHYFREDGSLAKMRSELRTFYGDFKVIKELYFDRRGKQLKRSVHYLDLTTNKPKKPTRDLLEGMAETEHYMHVNKLPFADLLVLKRN